MKKEMSQITNVTPLYETRFLSFYKIEYLNKLGELKSWIMASRKNYEVVKDILLNGKSSNADAVSILAFHKDEQETERIVMIKQFRVPVGDYIYEFPAGLIDNGETAVDAGIREFLEETGLHLENAEQIGRQGFVSAGMTDESISLVKGYCFGTPSSKLQEADEDIEILLLTKEEAKMLLNSDKKLSYKAMVALSAFVVN